MIALGLSAAVLLAGGFVLQQHQAAQLPEGSLRLGLLLVLLRQPVWLAGIATMVGGQVLGAVALGMGSLVVVEPLLATNVFFALPMAALASRRRLSAGDWVGAVLVIGGLALFLVGIAPHSTRPAHGPQPLTWAVIGGVYLIGVLLLLALARNRAPRTCAALTAMAAGALFGLQDFLTQRTVLRLGGGVGVLLTSWRPWVLLAVAVTGLTLAQRAFGLADLSASLPAITLAEPVAGIALSIGALGQELPHQASLLAAAIGGLVLMIAGVVLLTRSPLVLNPHATQGPSSAPDTPAAPPATDTGHARGQAQGHHR